MPKILVADDNSNVQRTVSLALSGLGIEVVAVNNGEAAVRKLSDFTPDLILADIFMPVRNGYEVCEYVKHASQLAQTPVVLLIGAFDPFDEREAQRVGADGILKKPFVPPDPLIAMVKTLLDRVLASRPVPAAVSAGPAASTQRSVASEASKSYPPAEEMPEESPETDYGTRERVAFGEGERPAAFGALFEAPTVELDVPATDAPAGKDDSLILTSKRDAALGDPGFWRKETEEEPDAAAFEASFATSGPPREIETPWVDEHSQTAVSAEEEPARAEAPFSVIHEVVEETAPTVSQDSILQDYAATSALSVDPGKSPDLAASPLDWMTSAPPVPAELAKTASKEQVTPVVPLAINKEVPVEPVEESSPIVSVTAKPLEAEFELEVAPVAPTIPVSPAIRPVAVPVEVAAVNVPEIHTEFSDAPLQPAPVSAHPAEARSDVVPTRNSVSSVPASAEKWSDLADTIEEEMKSAPVIPAVVAEKAPAIVDTIVAVAPAVPVAPVAVVVPVVSVTPTVEPTLVDVPVSATTGVSVAPPQVASPDPAVVDAVVQRVLEKMSPQVIDIITREFLRPVVQALVKREVERH